MFCYDVCWLIVIWYQKLSCCCCNNRNPAVDILIFLAETIPETGVPCRITVSSIIKHRINSLRDWFGCFVGIDVDNIAFRWYVVLLFCWNNNTKRRSATIIWPFRKFHNMSLPVRNTNIYLICFFIHDHFAETPTILL